MAVMRGRGAPHRAAPPAAPVEEAVQDEEAEKERLLLEELREVVALPRKIVPVGLRAKSTREMVRAVAVRPGVGRSRAGVGARVSQMRGGVREALLACGRGVRGGDAGWGRGRGEASRAARRAFGGRWRGAEHAVVLRGDPSAKRSTVNAHSA